MASSPEVVALKKDAAALERAYTDHGGDLSKDPSRQHLPCIFCGDETGFAILEATQDGAARWACFAGKSADCAVPAGKKTSGSIIDLVARKMGLDAAAATKACLERYTRGFEACGRPGAAAPAAGPRKAKRKGGGKWYADAVQAQNAWVRILGQDKRFLAAQLVKVWKYCDANALPVIETLRFDGKRAGKDDSQRKKPAKEFRQIHKDGQGWRLGMGSWGDPGKRCPLYGLPYLLKAAGAGARCVHVTEGEKACDHLQQALELCPPSADHGPAAVDPCTTAVGGWPEKSDWAPLAAYETVVIWQDVDRLDEKTNTKAGEVKADHVARHVRAAAPQARIVIVDLEAAGLHAGEDVYELIENERGNGADPAAVVAAIRAAIADHGRPWAPAREARFPGQPPPLPWDFGRWADDGERPTLRNWYSKKTKVEEDVQEPQPDGSTRIVRKMVERYKRFQLQQALVIDQVREITRGALCRVRAPGAREPLLFLDSEKAPGLANLPGGAAGEDPQAPAESNAPADFPRKLAPDADVGKSWSGGPQEGVITFLQNAVQFRSFLHDACKVQLADKRDHDGTKYQNEVDIFHAYGRAAAVQEYEAIQMRPHEPPIPGHYYAWRAPAGYRPDGRAFGRLLRFFTNCKTPKDLYQLAAAFMTPGWGGAVDKGVLYGCRPLQVVEANDQGSGKTTIAQVAGDLWGGWMPVQLSPMGIDTFLQRALSTGGLLTRLCLVDNVRGTLSHAAIEEWLTSKYIRGKRMYQGEAMRPNDLTWFTTLNNAKLSRDMAERAFFIELKKPTARADWSKELSAYVVQHGAEIVADILEILRAPLPFSSLGLTDRWAVWCEDVLARACLSPIVKTAVSEMFDGATLEVAEVIRQNQEKRGTCDIDIENADDFWAGVLEHLVAEYYDTEGPNIKWHQLEKDTIKPKADREGAKKPPFLLVKIGDMNRWALEIQGRKELNTAWIRSFIESHHNAGRMPNIWFDRTKAARGYAVAVSVVVEELRRVHKATLEARGMDTSKADQQPPTQTVFW